MYVPKLALLLSLIGGVARVDPDSKMRVRGEIHLLMIGDPGKWHLPYLVLFLNSFNFKHI